MRTTIFIEERQTCSTADEVVARNRTPTTELLGDYRVKPTVRKLVEEEFRRGASIPVVAFPSEAAEIPDTPRLTLVVADPELE